MSDDLASAGEAILGLISIAEHPGHYLLRTERRRVASARETLKPFIDAATAKRMVSA